MAEQKKTAWIVGLLILLGIGAVAARLRWMHPARPNGDGAVWRIHYEIRFLSSQPGERVRIALPDNTPSCRILRESFSRTGIAMEAARTVRTQGRGLAVQGPAVPGKEFSFSVEFDVQIDPTAEPATPPKQKLTRLDRQHYLRSERRVQTNSPAVRKAQAALAGRQPKPEGLLRTIYHHCCAVLEGDDAAGRSDAEGALRDGMATALGRTRAMIALCRVSGIPARPVAGFVLKEGRAHEPVAWVEAYHDSRWIPYDPERGYAGHLPPYFLPVRRDGVEIVRPAGQDHVSAGVWADQMAPLPAGSQTARHAAARVLDLSRLPVGMQQTLAVLLLLPAGALITAVFRNVVGIQTFGTFSPALIALSFLYSDLRTGLAVFVLVLAIGLGLRGLLEKLKLLMVPRLSVLLTAVVLCLAAAVSVLDYVGLTPSVQAVVLPLVIMTMMIERFFIRREEDGLGSALKLFAGTMLVAACCLALLRWEQLGRIALHFPECELFLAAALLLVGRYSGYRLAELIRFRDLARTPTPGG